MPPRGLRATLLIAAIDAAGKDPETEDDEAGKNVEAVACHVGASATLLALAPDVHHPPAMAGA